MTVLVSDEITCKKRPTSISLPRQVAMYLCRRMTHYSLPVIGSAFGRNHATVIHAIRTIEKRIKSDSNFRDTINILNQRIAKK